MNADRLGWYFNRVRRMSAPEIAWRARDRAMHAAWTRRQVHAGSRLPDRTVTRGSAMTSLLPPGTDRRIPKSATELLLEAAEALLKGRLEILGVERCDLTAPDWFFDPVTGRRAPRAKYAFNIEHRSEAVTGNVKQVWELSRLQHLTLMAAAWYVSHDDAFALAVDEQLRSWWSENPFLSGVHWTSGIEVGIRLISFTWIRRLLDEWPEIAALFEENETAVAQIEWHQEYLSAFRSRGSSANNHVIAEAAGLLVGSCAFPWYERSGRWRDEAAALLERELRSNTFPSGINRELASEYHGFVVELAMIAGIEAEAFGRPLHAETWRLVGTSLDALAAVVDEALRAPRQGDGDEGRGLVTDSPLVGRAAMLLETGGTLVGRAAWWPATSPTVTSTILTSLAPPLELGRPIPEQRPSHFADAGLTLLRTDPRDGPEIWCRCDGGPHGFLSIAGHAHADALSVELRHGGTEILVDPGTYCYHGEPEYRSYFRSTLGHNTVEIEGADQSESGGPFMWTRHARTSGVEVVYRSPGEVAEWSAEHDGYSALESAAVHKRTVSLDARARELRITDVIESSGRHSARLMLHLGPSVSCKLESATAHLDWRAGDETRSATIELPKEASWSSHRGEEHPALGWYSAGFGRIEPTVVLVGRFTCATGTTRLSTRIVFSGDTRPGTLADMVSLTDKVTR